MNNGISIYPGLDNTLEENIRLIETASKCNIRRIFTSLHIPETNKTEFKKDIKIILDAAQKNDMEVISDISPNTLKIFDIDAANLESIKKLGIRRLRLDFGYSAAEIAKMSQSFFVQLNASAISEKFLNELEQNNANFSNIDALHNFYPRKNTGLSEEFFVKKNEMLKKRGIKVGAFIGSRGKKRAPIYEGLTTLEFHRDIDPYLSARHLIALNLDSVFISESLPTDEELYNLGSLRNNEIILKINLLSKNEYIKELLKNKFTSRPDDARDVIRAQEGRSFAKKEILPENATERFCGDITVDNTLYKRYMGELQIIKNNLPKDDRVNVVAKILAEEIFMLKHILPEKIFSFIIINNK